MAIIIHPTAVVAEKAELEDNVEIGPFCIVEGGAHLGAGTRLLSAVRIEANTWLGKNNVVHHGACLGDDPQDLKYKGEPTFLRIGEGNIIREYMTIHRASGEGNATLVGSYNYLMAYTHVAHNCVIGDHIIMANAANIGGYVQVGDHTMIGGLVAVHQFVKVGSQVMIGGGFRVTKDVIPYILVGGYPAKPHGLNIVGLRRRGFTAAQLAPLKLAYKLLFNSGLNTSQAVEKIINEVEQTQEIRYLADFILNSNRGILK
ncbi:acyl-ACP--UDP-N-acetylglucosamine O-acyltransferase [bacterium]|nr:acyl-ACP--UDP-N-acetylglucosamine O-acyltransferase [bacterium]